MILRLFSLITFIILQNEIKIYLYLFFFERSIDISYIDIRGIAKSICERTSGGVKIAEIINIITIAYLRFLFKVSRLKIPNLTDNTRKIGVKKHIPNAFKSDVVKSI